MVTAAVKTPVPAAEIAAICTENGLLLEAVKTETKNRYYNEELLRDFNKAPYKTLLYFGFADKNADMSVSLSFVHDICERFITGLSHDNEIEFTRRAKPIDDDTLREIIEKAPFMTGGELIDAGWLNMLWSALSAAFEREIASRAGTVEEFLTSHNANLNVAGRVFFHLVEHKSEDCPFAVLATYSSGDGTGKARHLPLKNALDEHGDDQETLLKLLATVSKAMDRSAFISELAESGELFSPLRL
ncbi:MAG: ATP-dependent helicase, partial [Gracilibacteraceae bacterium]|nr:ATP-dependent helicase [Gracilibacteraceae bacterium]